jgi:biotin carboxylase
VIVEQFIQGFEITVDGYVFNGQPRSLSLARKSHVNSETRVAVDIKYPGEMPEEVYQAAMRNNEKVTQALGYKFGMIHSEYIVEDQTNDIYLVESANRGGGVYTAEVIAPAVSGIDLVKALVNDVLGLPRTQMPEHISRNEVILKFFTFQPGKIEAIHGLDKLNNDPSLLRFRLAVAPGDTIQPISNDANRHGFIIATDPTDVRKKVDELFRLISIQYNTQ